MSHENSCPRCFEEFPSSLGLYEHRCTDLGHLVDYLDREKPELKRGEILCGGCWAVGPMLAPVGWVFFNFKSLDPQWLCPECLIKYGLEFAAQQQAGL